MTIAAVNTRDQFTGQVIQHFDRTDFPDIQEPPQARIPRDLLMADAAVALARRAPSPTPVDR